MIAFSETCCQDQQPLLMMSFSRQYENLNLVGTCNVAHATCSICDQDRFAQSACVNLASICLHLPWTTLRSGLGVSNTNLAELVPITEQRCKCTVRTSLLTAVAVVCL